MAFYNSTSDPNDFAISFTQDPMGDFGYFAQGYAKAATTLTDSLLSRKFRDSEAYPVIFLYRHAFELSLKHIIYRSVIFAHLTFRDANEDILRFKHDLSILASVASKLLTRLFSEDDGVVQATTRFRVTAKEFSEIDKGSHSFRYPVDTKGQPSTPRHINLESFGTHMQIQLEELDAIHSYLDIESYYCRRSTSLLTGRI